MEQGTVPASRTDGKGARKRQAFQGSDPNARATMSPGSTAESELALLRRRLAIIGDQLGIPLDAPSSSYDEQVLKALRRQSDMWASKLLELESITDELVILRKNIADLKQSLEKRKGWRGLFRSIFDIACNRSPVFVRKGLVSARRGLTNLSYEDTTL